MDIDKGVILGQYAGDEMLEEEYKAVFNGTREDMQRSRYLWSAPLRVNGKNIDVCIDAYGACKSSVVLYINDGRKDIQKNATTKDKKKRMNTEYVSVLCNGWSIVFVRTTRKIKAGESLWIDYGPKYGELLDQHDAARKRKIIWWFNQILSGIDLEEDRPLEILSGDEDNAVNEERVNANKPKVSTKRERHPNAPIPRSRSFHSKKSKKRRRNVYDVQCDSNSRPKKKKRSDCNQ